MIVFIFSTIFFIYQRSKGIGWDFAAYVLNARYLFEDGNYFETFRPPLAPIVLGLLNKITIFGEYLYIILVSLLFYSACIKISDKICEVSKTKNLNKYQIRIIFYFSILTPLLLFYGLKEGTELLTLALLMLFSIAVLEKKSISGFYLGFATLARYTSLVYLPLILFSRNFKKILINVLIFLAILTPFFLWNYEVYGNLFTSIVDSYANNISTRQNIAQPIDPIHFFYVSSYIIPFFLLGLFVSFWMIFKNKNRPLLSYSLLAILILALTFYQYSSTPLKNERYLFNLCFPLAFFSTIGIIFLTGFKKSIYKFSIAILMIFFSISSLFLFSYEKSRDSDQIFKEIKKSIDQLNISDCTILSPHWVSAHYHTNNVYPLINQDLKTSIANKEIILLLKNEPTFDDKFVSSSLASLPILYQSDRFVFYAQERINKDCKKNQVYNDTYVKDHCKIISDRFKSAGINDSIYKSCKSFEKKL